VRAATASGDAAGPYGSRIARSIEARLAAVGALSRSCSGPTWFLCLERGGDRAALARGAEALIASGRPGARALAARVAEHVARAPAEVSWWTWGESDADAIALVAALRDPGTTAANERLVVLRDGTELATIEGSGWVTVPQGDGPLVLRFARATGRFAIARVDGEVLVRPDQAARGSVAIERRIVREAGDHLVEIDLQLREEAEDVVVTVPLAAGHELASRAGGGQVGVRGPSRSWRWWTGNPDAGPEVPEMARTDEGIVLRFDRVRAGRTTVRVPIAETAAGSFTAPGVRVRSADAEVWGLTAPLALTITR
jgi:hypothetical protein